MALQSRTFNYTFLPNYAVNTIVEVVHFRDLIFQSDELTAFYLDQAQATVNINSFNIGKAPDLTGDESEIEKSLALTKAESQSQKIGLKVLTRKNNTGTWNEIAEFVLLNYGRKDYLDLRVRLGYPTRLLERNDAIGFQLVDYGDGLLWDTDLISLSLGVTVDVSKKNDLTELSARIAALELALEGRLTNLPTNSLLGRNSANNGVVEVIPQTQFVEQIDLATVLTQHTTGDDHKNYLTNSRGDDRYLAKNRITVTNTAPLNLQENTWFTVGTVNNIGINSRPRAAIVIVYIQYGDGKTSEGHWQLCGATLLGLVQWKAGGSQIGSSFRVEAHNGNDFICNVRLGAGLSTRTVEVSFDINLSILPPSLLKVDLILL